jgi:FMN-dependent NADH-azoreductase
MLIEALDDHHPDLEVTTLDLFRADLPAVAGRNIESKYKLMTGQELDPAAKDSWRHIEKAIEQFLEADIYVLTVPMWNFGVPYALKYYIDAIVQPGYLFRYLPDGRPEGLVVGRKMICVTSRGGDYSGYMKSFDFLETYLRTIFGFVGITDLHFINAQPMDISADTRKEAFRAAFGEVRAYVAHEFEGSEHLRVSELPVGLKPAPLLETPAEL